MAHLSWYRKYRPQTFEDVVGQAHIERTLRNAVAENAVAHAYLFTGPRGTGKTTTARILAKALNCEQGPTPTPDDTCEQCLAIAAGTHPDVQELDAASRTGVDDVREQIIGRVNFVPTRGGWKIYIIDEVHMLSKPAFNALLKTLEEPPAHTAFVLCTTDAHKVPETIHSRCQTFDFRRLSVEEIVGRLRAISDAEGVTVPDGALTLIAKHALGGMRDAITTLEQLASFGGDTIAIEDVEGLLGEVDAELLFQAAELVLQRDVAGSFRFVAGLTQDGIDMSEFVKGLVGHFRDLYVLAAVGADATVDTTAEDLGRLESQAGRFGAERIARILELLARLTSELRHASDQRLAVEVALTRMARPQADLTLESLAERMDALEAGTPIRDVLLSATPAVPAAVSPSGATAPAQDAVATKGAASAPPSSGEQPSEQPDGGTPTPAPVGGADAVSTAPPSSGPTGTSAARDAKPTPVMDVATVKRAWPAILAEFKKLRPSRSQLFTGTEAEVSGSTLIVEFPANQAFSMNLAQDTETLALLRRSVASVLGLGPPVEFRLGRSGASARIATPHVDVAPALDVDDTSPAATPSATDLERMVIDELGAEVVDRGPSDETR